MVGRLYDGWAIGAVIVREGAGVVKKFAVVVGLTGLATWKFMKGCNQLFIGIMRDRDLFCLGKWLDKYSRKVAKWRKLCPRLLCSQEFKSSRRFLCYNN
jgi:hypothetical protein